MRLLNKLLAAGLAAAALTACSSDEPALGPGNGADDSPTPENGFYSKISLKMPLSRSESAEGTEIGQDFENKVGSILVVLATKSGDDYEFLTYAFSDAPNTTSNTHTIVFRDKESLFEEAGNEVEVFAFCNPTVELTDAVKALDDAIKADPNADKSFTDMICDTNIASTWTPNGFLMTSIESLTVTLDDEATLKTYNTPDHAFPLGTAKVARTASRFDLRDYTNNERKYVLYDPDFEATDDKTEADEIATIQLVNIAMVNRRSEFFYLPRTTAGLVPGQAGMEVPYVLTPAARNYTLNMPTTPLAHGDEKYAALGFTSIAGILGGNQDIDFGENNEEWGTVTFPNKEDREGYHIWRYTTENTFGADEELLPSQATGYIFEATVTPADRDGLFEKTGFQTGSDVMYVFNNRLYLNAYHIYLTVKDIPNTQLSRAFAELFDVNTGGDKPVVTPKAGKTDADFTDLGLTVYRPSDDNQYYCYYFAYNRHNDNGKPYETGPMEFATVRNNVYKLQVTKISGFGTFLPSENVEDWDVFFSLSVEVRPWTVRINNIEF